MPMIERISDLIDYVIRKNDGPPLSTILQKGRGSPAKTTYMR